MKKYKLINLSINLLLFFLFCAIFSGIIILINDIRSSDINNMMFSFVNLILCLCLFVSVYQLEKIIKSIPKNEVFSNNNVKRFNSISYPLYIIAFVNCFINNSNAGIQLLSFTKFFSIKMDTIIFSTLGFLSSLMAYIFSEAIRIKEKSKRLEEENKYTI
jgi:peptidoglycan/LPS O-acetylase OafA/YrhL